MESNNWLTQVILNESASTAIFILLYFRSRLHILSMLIISIVAPMFMLICLTRDPSNISSDQTFAYIVLVGSICIITIMEQGNTSDPVNESKIENKPYPENNEA